MNNEIVRLTEEDYEILYGDKFWNMFYDRGNKCSLDLGEMIDFIRDKLEDLYSWRGLDGVTFQDFIAVISDQMDMHPKIGLREEINKSDTYRYSLAYFYCAIYYLNSVRYFESGSEAHAWACISQAKYWLAVADFGPIDKGKVKRISEKAIAGAKGGKAKAEPYEKVRELMNEFIKNKKPNGGWVNKKQCVDAFVESNINHPHLRDVYHGDKESARDSLYRSLMSRTSSLYSTYADNKI